MKLVSFFFEKLAVRNQEKGYVKGGKLTGLGALVGLGNMLFKLSENITPQEARKINKTIDQYF